MDEQVQKLKDNVSLTFKDILEYELFTLGHYSLSVYELLAAILAIVFGWLVSRTIKSLIYKSEKFDLAKKFAFSQIIHYIIVIFTLFMAMKALGINISPLLLGSGAILVGIGLGLQNLFLDFISGVIILLDRSVKVGDVIDVHNTIGQVMEIRMRTTTVLTRENKNIIFPNSILTKERLINFSHSDDVVRFVIEVGVHYDTDINLAEKLMLETIEEHPDVIQTEKATVFLENFGESSLDLKLFYYSRNLFSAPAVRSEIRRKILDKFREHNINIPFPIRTLDFPKEFFESQNANVQNKL